MRVAVIGRGDVSVVHRAAIDKLGATLVGVATHDYRAMLDDQRPDVVHICTPHDTHVPIALDALSRGIHVLLEKPVAHTIAEAERLIAAATHPPVPKIGVCLQNRYNATSIAAREFLRDREILGASATVFWHRDAAYYKARPWRGQKVRSGGGVLINQAIHTVDLMQWLLGEARVAGGQIGRLGDLPGDVEDTATMVLDHTGGARSVLATTVTNATDEPVTITITTTGGTLHLRGDLTITHADGRIDIVPELVPDGGGRSYWGASHELLIADFYRSLDSPEPFWIGPGEALRSQLLIDTIYQ